MFKTVIGIGITGWLTCVPLATYAADAAANFPNAPIRLLVGSPPGASTDTYARIIAEPLGKVLGQNVLVENRTGASGIIATNAMLNAAADGYTLQFVYTSYTLSPHLYKDVKFDPIKDVAGISLIVTSPLALVVGSNSPYQTIDDMVTRSQKKSLNFGSAGIGSGGHLTGEMLKLETGLKAVHVPYRGAAPAATALAAGDVDFAFVAQVTANELMAAGKLRPLAVTSTKRSPAMPGTPTVQELGIKDYEFFNWFGVIAPAKTPRAVVDKINAAIAQVLKQPDVQKRLTADGSEVAGNTPAQFDAFLRSDTVKWGKLVEQIGMQKE